MMLYEGDKVTVADWDEMLKQNKGSYIKDSAINFGKQSEFVFCDYMKVFCGATATIAYYYDDEDIRLRFDDDKIEDLNLRYDLGWNIHMLKQEV